MEDSLKALSKEGHMYSLHVDDTPMIWSKAIQLLPDECLKFALNAAHDTLPHNANLCLRKKKPCDSCPLCKKDGQNLIHVLNNCPVALKLRRYNKWHDMVLAAIADFVRQHLSSDTRLSVDIGDQFQIPEHILVTDLRPDLMWWNDNEQAIVIAELTVCFESFELAVSRKTIKYLDLVDQATKQFSSLSK